MRIAVGKMGLAMLMTGLGLGAWSDLAAVERQFLIARPEVLRDKPPSCERVEDADFAALLNGLTLMGERELKSADLRVRVFVVDMPAGSAGGDSGDIAQSLYLAASTYRNETMGVVYRLPPMLSPRLDSLEEDRGAAVVAMSCMATRARQSFTVRIYLDGATGLPEASVERDCGDPTYHSDAYFGALDDFETAVVTEVVDANTVILRFNNGKRRRMELGGVEVPAPGSEAWGAARSFLSDLVLHKRIEFALIPFEPKDKVVGGLLSVEGLGPHVNEAMLESGLCTFGQDQYLTSYDRCYYQFVAERKAREQKRLAPPVVDTAHP